MVSQREGVLFTGGDGSPKPSVEEVMTTAGMVVGDIDSIRDAETGQRHRRGRRTFEVTRSGSGEGRPDRSVGILADYGREIRATDFCRPFGRLRLIHGDAGISSDGVEDTVAAEMFGGRLILVRALLEHQCG